MFAFLPVGSDGRRRFSRTVIGKEGDVGIWVHGNYVIEFDTNNTFSGSIYVDRKHRSYNIYISICSRSISIWMLHTLKSITTVSNGPRGNVKFISSFVLPFRCRCYLERICRLNASFEKPEAVDEFHRVDAPILVPTLFSYMHAPLSGRMSRPPRKIRGRQG